MLVRFFTGLMFCIVVVACLTLIASVMVGAIPVHDLWVLVPLAPYAVVFGLLYNLGKMT